MQNKDLFLDNKRKKTRKIKIVCHLLGKKHLMPEMWKTTLESAGYEIGRKQV